MKTHYVKVEAVANDSGGVKLRVYPNVVRAEIGDSIMWMGVGGKPLIHLEMPSGDRLMGDSMTIEKSGRLKFKCALVDPSGKTIPWDPNDPDSGHRVDIPPFHC